MPGNFLSPTPSLSEIPVSLGDSNLNVTAVLFIDLSSLSGCKIIQKRKYDMLEHRAFKKVAYAAEIATTIRYATFPILRFLPFLLNNLHVAGISLRHFSYCLHFTPPFYLPPLSGIFYCMRS